MVQSAEAFSQQAEPDDPRSKHGGGRDKAQGTTDPSEQDSSPCVIDGQSGQETRPRQNLAAVRLRWRNIWTALQGFLRQTKLPATMTDADVEQGQKYSAGRPWFRNDIPRSKRRDPRKRSWY